MNLDAIAPLIWVLGMGTFVLVGMRMWLSARSRRERGAPGDEVQRLAEAIDRLHDETRILRDELAELHERVDCGERCCCGGDPIARPRVVLRGGFGRVPFALARHVVDEIPS